MQEQPDVTNVTGTLTESGQFGAAKIADFSALSVVFQARRARLTGNPASLPHDHVTQSRSGGKEAMKMARAFPSKRHLALIATLAIPFAVSVCYAVSVHAKTDTRLQEVADNAALAGVNSLAASADQPADARSAAAIAAARTVIAAQSGVTGKLQPSVDGLTMSVIMEDKDKGTRVSATARYIPAKDGQPARQAANLSGFTAAAL